MQAEAWDPRGKRTAVLMIDIQRNFWSDNEGIREKFPHFPASVSKLLELCRKEGSEVPLVIHIKAEYSEEKGSAWIPYFYDVVHENSAMKNTSQNQEFEDFSRPVNSDRGPREIAIEKPCFDGFLQTNLEEELAAAGIQQVYACGLITSACVQHTVHGAFARGYCPVLFEDCCGDRSVEIHDAALGLYGGYMYTVATTKQLEQSLAREM